MKLRKIIVPVFAVVMLLAMCGNVLADNTSAIGDGGILGNGNSTETINSFTFNVKLNKATEVNTPAETATFVISPAESTEVANPYHTGPADGIKFNGNNANTATFPVNASGKNLTQTVTVTVDNSKFIVPGIYRYKIVETVNKMNLGFASADATTKYIDVYAKKTDGTDVNVYAVVMGNELDATTKAITTSGKDAGFEINYTVGDDDNNSSTPDAPADYSVTVSKATTGNGGDTDEFFPFTISIAAISDAAGVECEVTTTGNGTANVTDGKITLGGTDAVSFTGTLKSGSTIVIHGLPKTASVTVTENYTGNDYKTAINLTALKTNTNKSDLDGSSGKERIAADEVVGIGGTFAFTNSRETISPTGIVLRYAPFILMAAGAIVLLVVMCSRKKDTRNKSNYI